jgi:acetylornithine deacetylase/succinyl-diaminopimelate desuccinylase-like protein
MRHHQQGADVTSMDLDQQTELVAAHARRRVVDVCRDLVRIESTNPGKGERKAAEHVAALLTDMGLTPHVSESEPGRTSVVARVEGADRSRPALLVHGHLDVVPVQAADWTYPPFAGEIHDGSLWGRGCVDMKDMVAMTLSVAQGWHATGTKPPRDVVLAFTADEEAGGTKGAHDLVVNHTGHFEGVTEAIGEVGGFSVTVRDDLRLYLVQTAEKGIEWLRLTAKARAGHGSMVHPDNAVTALAEAVSAIGRYEHPVELTPTAQRFLEEITEVLGIPLDPSDADTAVAKLGPISRMIGASLRNTSNPSMLQAGYKVNVIPAEATAEIDCRFLPEHRDAMLEKIRELAGPGISIETTHGDIAVETGFNGDIVEAMGAALRTEDPHARTVPYMMSGGTDAKHFSTLGIRCFGFAPLLLPPDLDFSALFHGVDERVPTAALEFGATVFSRFLAAT